MKSVIFMSWPSRKVLIYKTTFMIQTVQSTGGLFSEPSSRSFVEKKHDTAYALLCVILFQQWYHSELIVKKKTIRNVSRRIILHKMNLHMSITATFI